MSLPEFRPGWADAFGLELAGRKPVSEVNPVTLKPYKKSAEVRERMGAAIRAGHAYKRAQREAQS